MSFVLPAADFSRDRSSWTASGGSKPLSPYRTAGPTAEHLLRPRAYLPDSFTTALVPVVGLGGIEQQQASCTWLGLWTTKAAAAAANQGMEIVVGTRRMKKGSTSANPTNCWHIQAFTQGRREIIPGANAPELSTADTLGRREAEWSHRRKEEGSVRHGDSGFPLLGRMPFRKWARTRAWVSFALEKEAKGLSRHGEERRGGINDDSDRGSIFFLKSQGPLWQTRRYERASPATRRGGVDVAGRDDFDNGSRFLAGIEQLGQKLHAGDPTKTGPWSRGWQTLVRASALVPSSPLCPRLPWRRGVALSSLGWLGRACRRGMRGPLTAAGTGRRRQLFVTIMLFRGRWLASLDVWIPRLLQATGRPLGSHAGRLLLADTTHDDIVYG
ncbi:hypothetical protein QBC39DRAFT_333504 [Podospora conica]|nr:hypothetical protein QBC39DRAFT_333504 [Schizothecium conicum]